MALSYEAFEKQVFEWLMKKHQQDNNFCFSTRQKASKGSERDYFIGTKKSGYFATTFWWIPVAFPGSSTDLINLVFADKRNGIYHVYIQFNQTRNPHNKQNELALLFIQQLKNEFYKNGIKYWENDAGNKMEYYNIGLASVSTITEKELGEISEKLDEIITITDNFLTSFKAENVRFTAERIDKQKFESLFMRRLKDRLNKYTVPTSTPLPQPAESEEKTNKYIPKYDFSLNTILYGPPGTGKTFSTIEKAIQIADPEYYHENATDRDNLKSRFYELIFKDLEKETEAQIAFCTFHQSMSYEDFVEGIKPKTEDGKVLYEVQDGIFKHVANTARKNYLASQTVNELKEDFDVALEKLKNEWGKNKQMQFSMKLKGYEFTILDFTDYSIRFRNASGGTSHTLSLATLQDAYYGRKEIRSTGVGIYYPGVLEKLNSCAQDVREKTELKNYVIVIDEINRGNVSHIFGELITCIEDSKRMGPDREEIEVLLPYSKMSFSVPPNLYIVGTMNTADRSVEALDTALRRRFVFEEMIPKPSIIQDVLVEDFFEQCIQHEHLDWDDSEWLKIESMYTELLPKSNFESFKELDSQDDIDWTSIEEIKGKWKSFGIEILTVKLLTTINERIEVLLNRDNLIGHSYFIGQYTWVDLKRTIFKNIIPLLQEYFYGDYAKIGLVLGKGFVRVKHDEKRKTRFADFAYEDADSLQRKVYELIPQEEINIQDAIRLLLNVKTEA